MSESVTASIFFFVLKPIDYPLLSLWLVKEYVVAHLSHALMLHDVEQTAGSTDRLSSFQVSKSDFQ